MSRLGKWRLEPISNENYKGRQYGWYVRDDNGVDADGSGGQVIYHIMQAGSGVGWHICDAHMEPFMDEDYEIDDNRVSFSSFNDFIELLELLRDSDEHKEQLARWRYNPDA